MNPHWILGIGGILTVIGAFWTAVQTNEYQNDAKAQANKIDATTAEIKVLNEKLEKSQDRNLALAEDNARISELRYNETTGGDSYPFIEHGLRDQGLGIGVKGEFPLHRLHVVVRHYDGPFKQFEIGKIKEGRAYDEAAIISDSSREILRKSEIHWGLPFPRFDENGELILYFNIEARNGSFGIVAYMKPYESGMLQMIQTVWKDGMFLVSIPEKYPKIGNSDVPDWAEIRKYEG